MIIDAEVHLVGSGWVRGKYVMAAARAESAKFNLAHKKNVTPEEYLNTYMRPFVDPHCDKMVEDMDQSGIDMAVIWNVDWAFAHTGEPRVTNREQNKIFAENANRHPGRFWPLFAIDPRRPDVMEQFKEAIEEWGMKGLSLYPAAGFYPDNEVCFPLYEKCADLKMPVVLGSGGGEAHWQHSQPMYIASAAERYPEVTFVMAHCGLESWEQAQLAARLLNNVYVDISMRQWQFHMRQQRFYNWLRDMIDEAGVWKIMWASDWPSQENIVSRANWLKAFQEPDTDIEFTSEEMDIMLGKAAQAVFGIPD
jgi:predicted TIM-barrel fold metal-dependent hydrolase